MTDPVDPATYRKQLVERIANNKSWLAKDRGYVRYDVVRSCLAKLEHDECELARLDHDVASAVEVIPPATLD